MTWTKTGGNTATDPIKWTASEGGWTIIRYRRKGERQWPALYRHDLYVRSYKTVQYAMSEARAVSAAESK